ncbi:hypothetical protein IAD21_06053 [Abditibacteriota bacterium]|nr:hypothetical protein IAD21_06053 [Abditibacteriota bacterium]
MISATLTSSQLQQFALRELGLWTQHDAGTHPVTDSEVVAESLRCALWTMTNDGQEPVYVTRWLNLARRLAQPALFSQNKEQERVDELLRDVMSDLESLGDVAAMPQGYRLPAPVRAVPLSNSSTIETWLLVGGLPSHKFPHNVQPFFVHRGAARLWQCDPSTLVEIMGIAIPLQSESLWRCDSTSSATQLEEWTHRALSSAILSALESYEAEFEAYVPGNLAHGTNFRGGDHAFQWKRWTVDLSRLRDGRYLMKRRNRFGVGEMRVGQLLAGKLCATGTLARESSDVRRLLYGLDLLSGSPTLVSMKKVSQGTVFRLRNEVPRSQNRLLLALGTLLPPSGQGSYYPRDWLIPAGHEKVMCSALQSLGAQLEDRPW